MSVAGAGAPVVDAAVWVWTIVLCGGAEFVMGAYAWWAARRARVHAAERARERRMREELEAYVRLDATLAQGVPGRVDQVQAEKALAMRVCRTVAEKSSFRRVMMLLRNAEGRLRCVGSTGVDDLTLAAVERWAEQVVKEEREGGPTRSALLGRGSAKSVPIGLGEWDQFDREVSSWEMSGKKERRRWRRAIVLPVRTAAVPGSGAGGAGKLVGAIVVCSDGLAVPPIDEAGGKVAVDRLLSPLETLAGRLGRAMENEALAERLLRAEKLAGLGQLAGGVAHVLNNPLTAVLGYAELIAETSSEPRVRDDARTIAAQAMKMRETVQRLIEFWRPAPSADEPLDVEALIREVAEGHRARLSARGIALEVLTHGPGAETSPMPAVRGCRDRLRQVVEHLLNNAEQAIARADEPAADEETHAIRVSVSQDEHMLHLIVSDTGTGFEDPGRAFDPFYTTKDPVEGAGLGLSICYGVVREHGGEIAAFNLHPRGAAVVVDLPLGAVVRDEERRDAERGNKNQVQVQERF
jgi:signal transduction histidine kinase